MTGYVANIRPVERGASVENKNSSGLFVVSLQKFRSAFDVDVNRYTEPEQGRLSVRLD